MNIEEQRKNVNCLILFKTNKGTPKADIQIIGDSESLYQGFCNLLELLIQNNVFDELELTEMIKVVIDKQGNYKCKIRED